MSKWSRTALRMRRIARHYRMRHLKGIKQRAMEQRFRKIAHSCALSSAIFTEHEAVLNVFLDKETETAARPIRVEGCGLQWIKCKTMESDHS